MEERITKQIIIIVLGVIKVKQRPRPLRNVGRVSVINFEAEL